MSRSNDRISYRCSKEHKQKILNEAAYKGLNIRQTIEQIVNNAIMTDDEKQKIILLTGELHNIANELIDQGRQEKAEKIEEGVDIIWSKL